MSPSRSRLLLAVSCALLAGLVLAWALWPDDGGQADLVAVAPIETTTTTTAPTTTAPTAPDATSTTTTAPPGVGAPTRLRIPAIGVDARIVPVALRLDGQMEVPPAADVGWYRLGPAPGAAGSSVLAAHVDLGGQRGAFFDLRALPVGAEITVEGDRSTQRFVVSNREQYPKAGLDLSRYFTGTGGPLLTLITCGGAFDQGARHYADNIIITAEPVG